MPIPKPVIKIGDSVTVPDWPHVGTLVVESIQTIPGHPEWETRGNKFPPYRRIMARRDWKIVESAERFFQKVTGGETGK